MAVVTVHTWRIRPGRLQEVLTNVSEARKIHERLGSRVRTWQTALGGEANSVVYVIEHESMSAYGAFTDKLMADNGWQSFLQRIMESDEPGAEHVSRLSGAGRGDPGRPSPFRREMDALLSSFSSGILRKNSNQGGRLRSLGGEVGEAHVMAVISVNIWRVRPGRLQEVLGYVGEARKIHERLGGRVRTWQPIIGGEPNTFSYVIEYEDIAAYGNFTNKVLADGEWQSFLQRLVGNTDPGAELVSSSLLQPLEQ
jgi:hypothetical protein